MPWKQGYTISDETSLPDAAVHWPDKNACCMRIVVDLGLATKPEGLRPGDLRNSEAVFAMGQGLDLVLDLLDRFSLKATFAMPAMLAAVYAARARALQAAGHEIAINGLKQEDVSLLSPAEERRRLEIATRMVADVTGEAPAGWFGLPRVGDHYAVGTVSASTVDLLIEAGYSYLGAGLADDLPHYWVTNFDTRSALLALPSYYHFNDQYFMMFPRKGSGLENSDGFIRNLRWEFDAQYARGRHLEMTLHPQHVAWCNRLPGFERFFGHVRQKAGVWNPTSAQCAQYWLQAYPAASTLKLEPSVWKDYEGSLS